MDVLARQDDGSFKAEPLPEPAVVPDVDAAVSTAIEPLEERVDTLEATVAGLAEEIENPPTPVPSPVAYVGVPYTVVTQPTDAAIQAGVKAWLADRSGVYPRTNLLFAFTGTVNAKTPCLPRGTGQVRRMEISGLGKGRTVVNWSDATTPWFTADGQMRDWRIGNLTLQSSVAGARGFRLVSNDTGANQDGTFERIEFKGAWQYAYRLEGAANANLNSEVVWDRPSAGNDASFVEGFWHIGANGNAAEDQFVNYTIRDSKLEGSHGDYLVIRKGGQITLEGFNSWMHTGQSNGAVPAGRMIYMPAGSHYDSPIVLRVHSLKPELRGTKSVLIDCAWPAHGSVQFHGLDDTSNSYRVGDYAAHIYRGEVDVLYDHCRFGSHIETYAAAQIDLRKPRVVKNLLVNTLVRPVSGAPPNVTIS